MMMLLELAHLVFNGLKNAEHHFESYFVFVLIPAGGNSPKEAQVFGFDSRRPEAREHHAG